MDVSEKTVEASPPGPPPNARRYLALWFPYLACERASRQIGPLELGPELGPKLELAPQYAPFVLVARAGNTLWLTAVDAPARRRGLAVGMTLADARARCPDLASLPHDPHADTRELDVLATRMLGLTPRVALDPPDGLLLDITGAAHLFGSEAHLARLARAKAGYTARHALAGHAAGARALVRYGNQDIHALPVAALELSEEALSGLRRAGLHTLGDLARRPMAGLAARFGEATVARLRAILGHTGNPIVPYQTTAPITAAARFAEPIARTEHVPIPLIRASVSMPSPSMCRAPSRWPQGRTDWKAPPPRKTMWQR